jgi:hypothetical protein
MNVAKNITFATAAAAILTLNAAAPQAAERSAQVTMKPLQGISFNLGTKHAASYFLRKDGVCKLVLTVAEAPNWNEVPTFTATRFEAAVPAHKQTRFSSVEGNVLEFACHAGANSMSVEPVDQVAIGKAR